MSNVVMYNPLYGADAFEHIAHLGSTLTTLTYCPYDAEFLDKLLDNSSTFPNLRCLCLSSANGRWTFWETIQNEFPNLVSLTVHAKARGAPGRYVLRSLEILDVDSWEGFQLVCPSLKHFALGYSNSIAVREFVIEHGHQLESFISPTWLPRSSPTPEDFWSSICPNLVTFGKNTVHIRARNPSADDVKELKRKCQKKGIRLVEIVTGEVEKPQPPLMAKVLTKVIYRDSL
ncbi:hypothetical protein FRC17_003811 [Serendipita sp. 399]|nr:hypothetical protein FRC17_003811 [Serendipita sp. 399]